MFPPDVERYFAEERAKQQNIAKTQKNLKETTVMLHNIIEKVNQRGVVVQECETQSEDLLDSSEEFYLAHLPGWKRFIYTWKAPWWVPGFCSCSRMNKKRCLF